MSRSYRASRFEMMQAGVPEDYVDALLDDDYMEKLILATQKEASKRDRKTRRHFLLQKVIFWFLLVQAVVGVFVAVFKTFMEPDFVYGSKADIESVDLVLMLDASRHMGDKYEMQHKTVRNFSAMMKTAMLEHIEETRDYHEKRLAEMEEEGKGALGKFFDSMLKHIASSKPKNQVSVRGGKLRFSTGIFNARGADILHNFTDDLEEQKTALEAVQPDKYTANALFLSAMEECEKAFRADGEDPSKDRKKRFCVIIGDNEAMCARIESEPVQEACADSPDICPHEDERKVLGDTILEYPPEIGRCTDFVRDSLQPRSKAIMMFTVGSAKEEQLRLKNPSFQKFVRRTTNCTVLRRAERVADENGHMQTVEVYYQEEECLRFIIATSYEDVLTKSQRIVNLLKSDQKVFKDPNPSKDRRFLFFLLLPLNLVFFVVWSKIVRLVTSMTKKVEKKMGKKKKMIKVTKQVVEKPRRESNVERFAAALSEVEMAEMGQMRPPIEFGMPLTLRARLKGGYLRSNEEKGVADGFGKAFDNASNWSFEPVDGSPDGTLQPGQRFRIRNAAGKFFRVGPEDSGFLDEGESPDAGCEFQLEPASGNDTCHLGDTMRLKAVGTDKYLRVQKDGSVNGLGEESEPDTQMVIDRGGQPIQNGSVITLMSSANDCFLYGNPKGELRALPEGEAWRFWRIEKKQGAGEAASSVGRSTVAAGAGSEISLLKQGDVVTLTGFNQKPLEVGRDRKAHCGAGSQGLTSVAEEEEGAEESSSPASAPGVQEFVIERVGMGLVGKKYEQTIRKGTQVTLRPVRQAEAISSSGDPDGGPPSQLRVHEDGTVTADGRVTQQEISFTIDIGKLLDLVSPMQNELYRGDVDLLLSPLWSKKDYQHVAALSATWTSEEDLGLIKGPVVVANERNAYNPPKTSSGDSGWVAVVGDTVDIPKAARQAKLQGATGLIVRCDDVLTIHKRAWTEAPDLPTVFVDKTTADDLDERGIVLAGAEFKKKYVKEVMNAVSGTGQGTQGADIFRAAGGAMEQVVEERRVAAAAAAAEQVQVAVVEEQSNYKWKVKSNTCYLWSTGTGGSTKMDVNYGKSLPPAAKVQVKQVTQADASGTRAAEDALRKKSVAIVDAEALKRGRFAEDMGEVLNAEDVDETTMEQLPEESDFTIQYNFEEIEVGIGEKVEDVEEEELMDEEGAVIQKLGVPLKHFYLVGAGLVGSTLLLMALLIWQLNRELKVPSLEDEESASIVDSVARTAMQSTALWP